MCNERKILDFVALRNIPWFCLEITPFPTEAQGRCISNQQKIIENLMLTLEENGLGDPLIPGELSAASQSSNDLTTSQPLQGMAKLDSYHMGRRSHGLDADFHEREMLQSHGIHR